MRGPRGAGPRTRGLRRGRQRRRRQQLVVLFGLDEHVDEHGAGGTENASAEGKTVFTQNCKGCHTLKDAGATGSVGPNLDDLKPPKATVVRQVNNGGGPMPAFKGKLSDAQIDAVATYVSTVAGQS